MIPRPLTEDYPLPRSIKARVKLKTESKKMTKKQKPALGVKFKPWVRGEYTADRQMECLKTGDIDELNLQLIDGKWTGEYNSPSFSNAVEITGLENAKTMDEAIAAADLWFETP